MTFHDGVDSTLFEECFHASYEVFPLDHRNLMIMFMTMITVYDLYVTSKLEPSLSTHTGSEINFFMLAPTGN